MSAPPFKKTYPCTILLPLFLNFQSPPSGGGVMKIYSPHPLKMGRGPNYVESPTRMMLKFFFVSVSVSKKNAPLFLNNGKFKTYSSSVFHFKVFHLSHNKTSNKNHSPSSHRISISSKRWKLIPFYFELMIWEARIKFCLVNA